MKEHFILNLRAKLNYQLEKLAYLSAKVELKMRPRKNSSASQKTVIGHGNHTYIPDLNWAKIDPKKHPVRNCHEMVIDHQNRIILLTDHPKNNILIFDRSGELLDGWTLGFKTAHGLSIGHDDEGEFLLITDFSSGRVLKTSLDGDILFEFPSAYELGVYSSTMPYDPTETAIAPNGDVYVADGYGSFYILQFSSDGKFIRHFGGPGKEDRHLNNPHGIAVDARSGPDNCQLIISSRMQSCFKRFSMEGDYLKTISLPGTFPCRPVIHGDLLYAAVCWSGFFLKPNSGFVIILDKDDKVVSCPGGSAPINDNDQLLVLKQEEKIFYHCHDVCVDGASDIYVCQWNAQGVYPYKLKRQMPS